MSPDPTPVDPDSYPAIKPQSQADYAQLMPWVKDLHGSSRIVKYWMYAVVLFVCWQPLELGFYMDDWAIQADLATHGAAFSKTRLRSTLRVDPTRPGSAVARFVLSSLFGDRPVLWQLAMLLASGLVSVFLARASEAITASPRSPIALAFTLSWLILDRKSVV